MFAVCYLITMGAAKPFHLYPTSAILSPSEKPGNTYLIGHFHYGVIWNCRPFARRGCIQTYVDLPDEIQLPEPFIFFCFLILIRALLLLCTGITKFEFEKENKMNSGVVVILHSSTSLQSSCY